MSECMLVNNMLGKNSQKGKMMLSVEKIKELLQDRNADKVAKSTGLHPNTVRAIRCGHNKNPTAKTIRALSEYLAPEQRNDK